MTDHPAIAAGCTKRQVEVFEQIAAGSRGYMHPRTLDALAEKGLIAFERVKEGGMGGRAGYFKLIPYVPLPLHYQWCKWCDENVSDEDVS